MKSLNLTTEDIVRLYYTIPVHNRIAERPEGWSKHLSNLKLCSTLEKFVDELIWLLENNYYICLPAVPDWFLRKHHMELDDFTGFRLQQEQLEFSENYYPEICNTLEQLMYNSKLLKGKLIIQKETRVTGNKYYVKG